MEDHLPCCYSSRSIPLNGHMLRSSSIEIKHYQLPWKDDHLVLWEAYILSQSLPQITSKYGEKTLSKYFHVIW